MQPKRAARAYSLPSEEAVQALHRTELELQDLEQTVVDVMTQFDVKSLTPGQARTALSTVEARAQKLEGEGIDNVYTGELHSGKEQAKSDKKGLLKRIEDLYSVLEKSFKEIKDVEAAP
mmetsp:Transcript_45836/g.90951  ORF Transcript_45836/g.90951 Transcript_45836/m.90951 type:complete len:119 (-) Transcript_45836:109-465(-)